MKLEDAALAVMKEQRAKHVWYGTPDLVCEIYERSGLKGARHPLNKSAAVVGALAKSRKFQRIGRITHQGRSYPVYERAR